MMENSSPSEAERSALVLWSTSTGRAKACARRSCRMLRGRAGVSIFSTSSSSPRSTPQETQSNCDVADDSSSLMPSLFGGMSFDEFWPKRLMNIITAAKSSSTNNYVKRPPWLILFVSTTGDGEHCDSILQCWNFLLQKSLPRTQFQGVKFALFALGDRAYGEAFCAAGRKLASRLVQLGAKPLCRVGYGDDGTPNGGVFADLDEWLVEHLLPAVADDKYKSKVLDEGVVRQNAEFSVVSEEENAAKIFQAPYRVTFLDEKTAEGANSDSISKDYTSRHEEDNFFMDDFFLTLCPLTSYAYSEDRRRESEEQNHATTFVHKQTQPLIGKLVVNDRITAADWEQDVRHLRIMVLGSSLSSTSTNGGQRKTSSCVDINSNSIGEKTELPYDAGDVAVVLPRNSDISVQRFLNVLPSHIRDQADRPICITRLHGDATPWPQQQCTFRRILKCCADINGRPEREFLRWLSVFVDEDHPQAVDQASKLVELSDPSGAALFADYILREKRNFADVFYDFDALRSNCCEQRNNVISLEHLLALLPPIRPRHFSIASSPSMDAPLRRSDEQTLSNLYANGGNSSNCTSANGAFAVELCVAVVEGTTPLGRSYRGLCSGFLCDCVPESSRESNSCVSEKEDSEIHLWIRPGTFGKLPLLCKTVAGKPPVESYEDERAIVDNNNPLSPQLKPSNALSFERPVMCIGAGTGIAPLRGIIRERQAKVNMVQEVNNGTVNLNPTDNILVFGCRHKKCDFHYKDEWLEMTHKGLLTLHTAFSRDQFRKIYVQILLKENNLVLNHLIDRQGALYVAGGAKMAKCVRDEVIEILGDALAGGQKEAKLYLKRLQKNGLFSVEAWN